MKRVRRKGNRKKGRSEIRIGRKMENEGWKYKSQKRKR